MLEYRLLRVSLNYNDLYIRVSTSFGRGVSFMFGINKTKIEFYY